MTNWNFHHVETKRVLNNVRYGKFSAQTKRDIKLAHAAMLRDTRDPMNAVLIIVALLMVVLTGLGCLFG